MPSSSHKLLCKSFKNSIFILWKKRGVNIAKALHPSSFRLLKSLDKAIEHFMYKFYAALCRLKLTP